MKDFILASLPWVICGISIAIIVVNCNKEKDKNLSEKTYLNEGRCLGMCFGVLLGSLYSEYLGIFLALGMLIGEAIGSFIKKKTNKKKINSNLKVGC